MSSVPGPYSDLLLQLGDGTELCFDSHGSLLIEHDIGFIEIKPDDVRKLLKWLSESVGREGA